MRRYTSITAFIFGFVFSLVFFSGCSSAPVDNFGKVKVNMTKDEVLEIVGSPNRTERFEGKEKWAYRFFTDESKEHWNHQQVTFVDGKVVSVGEDVDEESRLKTIGDEDKARAERRKSFKLAPAPADPAPASTGPATISADPIPDPVIPKESDFVEVKGKRNPVNSDNDDNK